MGWRRARCWCQDRNFGVFSTAWAAQQRSLEVVARVIAQRARKLAGGPISEEGERAVNWTPSGHDAQPPNGLPPGAAVQGRLIAARIGRGKAKEWLYLFTTLPLPRQQVLVLYGKRWRIGVSSQGHIVQSVRDRP